MRWAAKHMMFRRRSSVMDFAQKGYRLGSSFAGSGDCLGSNLYEQSNDAGDGRVAKILYRKYPSALVWSRTALLWVLGHHIGGVLVNRLREAGQMP